MQPRHGIGVVFRIDDHDYAYVLAQRLQMLCHREGDEPVGAGR